jgi:hypothetical protein
MKAKRLSPKAVGKTAPKLITKSARGMDCQLPPTSATPINQRKQLAGTHL